MSLSLQVKCDLCGATTDPAPFDPDRPFNAGTFARVSIQLPRKIRSEAAADLLDRVTSLGPAAEIYMEGVADSFYLEDFRVSLHVCEACQEGRLWEAVEARWKAAVGEAAGVGVGSIEPLRAVDDGDGRRSWDDDIPL